MSEPLRIAIFTLGGTIAMTAQSAGGVTPTLSAEDLVAAVPGLGELDVELQVHNFRQLPGASLTFDDLIELYDAILNADLDGAVVIQGTDTIEETSFFLDLVSILDAPIVVTGAMRNASMAGADGPANILAAVRVAASEQAAGLGSVVVFGNEVHAARYVRKTNSTSPTPFSSNPGPIGYIAENRVVIQLRPDDLPRVTPSPLRRVRTAVATITVGDDGAVLEAIGAHVDGLVVAAFGVGHVPQLCVEVLDNIAKRMPVVLASRTGSGPVLSKTYGFPGSESDLLARGLIPAGTLDPFKARILLQAALMANADAAALFSQVNGL